MKIPYLTPFCFAVAFSFVYTNPALTQDSDGVEIADENLADAERLFVTTVKPLFAVKCGGCHGDRAKEIKGDLDMRSRAGLLRGGESGEPAIVPGSAEMSPLLAAVRWDGIEMPPKENDRLSTQEIDSVRIGLRAEHRGLRYLANASWLNNTGPTAKWTPAKR